MQEAVSSLENASADARRGRMSDAAPCGPFSTWLVPPHRGSVSPSDLV